MEIKDIVNRDLVNLVNCESEPIHVPGTIQPHGFLLALNEDLSISFCSANTAPFIGLSPAQLLGRSIGDVAGKHQEDSLRTYIHNGSTTSHPFVFTFNGIAYNTTIHTSNDVFILELEPFPNGTLDLPDLYDQTRVFVSMLEGTSYLPQLCRDIATETRRLTGYDRVMIYRFDASYNGEVIAEAKREDLESFAGQKYPHTDIPVQARELYIRNKMRMIADVNYTPVPVYTIAKESIDNTSLDLSLSVLRSVSPIHIQYLQNMGVGATLTVSLILDKKLWGLIACHHYSPKVLPHYSRLSALLQGHFLTSQINVREVAEEFGVGKKTDAALNNVLQQMKDTGDFLRAFPHITGLRDISNATGVVFYYQGKMFKNGIVPTDQHLKMLIDLLINSGKSSLQTESLSHVFPEAKVIAAEASGMIYYSISGPGDDCIMWFRQEMVETINWAGNPDDAVHKTSDNRLTPRMSFELWVEEVRNKSRAWRTSETNAAAAFAYALQKYVHLDLAKKQEESARKLNEELQQANKELENINWISTHDLREPLRKIRILASKIVDLEGESIAAGTKDALSRMSSSAVRMQDLINDVLSYSRIGNTEKVFESTDLNAILTEVLHEMEDTIKEKNAKITADPLPVIKGIPFQLRQLFQNLIQNAIKFHKPGYDPGIVITSNKVKGDQTGIEAAHPSVYYNHIAVKDEGIGFDQQYSEKIFNVFQRLHAKTAYTGSGVGLAICRKILQNHGGFINASSAEGEGSVFHIWIPVS